MSHVNRGLPLSNTRVEQVFPTLTPAQIRRIATPGRTRVLRPGEVFVEQGDSAVPFFVVISGELQVLRPSGVDETLVTVLMLETSSPGGQAGSSSRIENYLGFPTGISGRELAGRAYTQAEKFGALPSPILFGDP